MALLIVVWCNCKAEPSQYISIENESIGAVESLIDNVVVAYGAGGGAGPFWPEKSDRTKVAACPNDEKKSVAQTIIMNRAFIVSFFRSCVKSCSGSVVGGGL